MDLMVNPAAGHARVGGRSIFLDVDKDRYVAAGPEASRMLECLAKGEEISGADFDHLSPLIQAGLITAAPDGRPLAPLPGPPACEWGERDGDGASGLMHLSYALWRIWWARRKLRSRPLRPILDELVRDRSEGSGGRDDDPDQLATLVIAFRRSRIVLPSLDQCLPRALALATALARHGVRARLVFGVAMPPFMAHCWVERDGVVLDDHVDVVRNFTPILIV